MARWDEVTLYGQVAAEPVLYYANKDPDGELLRVIAKVLVLRGLRKYGAKDERNKLDILNIMSGDQRQMKDMSTWQTGSMVMIRGQLITQNHMKHCTCPECGHVQAYQGYSAYIDPIYSRVIAVGYDAERGLIDLKRQMEISNRITAIGTVTADPRMHLHEKSNNWISSYVLKLDRKIRVKEDAEDNHCDFPVVKSYGNNALLDHALLQAGSQVLIDGMLQARNYDRGFECEACGAKFRAKDYVVEIIPYSTEYLKDCFELRDVTIEELDKQAHAEWDAMVEEQIFGTGENSEGTEV